MNKLFTAGLIAIIGLFTLSGTAAALRLQCFKPQPFPRIGSEEKIREQIREHFDPQHKTKRKQIVVMPKDERVSPFLLLELPTVDGQDGTTVKMFQCPIVFIENSQESTVAIKSNCLEEAMKASLSYASTAEENIGSMQVYIRPTGSEEMIALEKVSMVNKVYPQFKKQQTQNGDVYVFTFSNEKMTSEPVETVSLEEDAAILSIKAADSHRMVTPGAR